MLLLVAGGGAIGAMSRYLVTATTIKLLGPSFPLGTLIVNVVGSFAMGILVAASALRFDLSVEIRTVLAVGFLGAFTTFSTFSLDAVTLYERGRPLAAGAYVLTSTVGSLAALAAGLVLVRRLYG